MKKRACRHHCDRCNLGFETWYRYTTHVSSRGHLEKELATMENVRLVEDEYLPESDFVMTADDENDGLFTTFEEERIEFEPPEFADTELSSDDEELSENGDTSEITDQMPNDDSNFFPFPSEIFFLLYSYAHNTSRPKVHNKLWLFL